MRFIMQSRKKSIHILSGGLSAKCSHRNDSNVRFSRAIFVAVFCVVFPCFSESREIKRNIRSPSPSDPFIIDSRADDSSFKVFWNVPTFQCHSKKVFFEDISKYGIIQNDGDSFRGNKIAILYDPGNFPALLENGSQSGYFYRNGGIPQEGDLNLHLRYFQESLEQQIPEEDFDGLAIINFESWRPIFRQNWGTLAPYKDVSYENERKRHPLWPASWVKKEAIRRYEESGKKFMEQTIALAKEIRPFAKWGYYAYPYCFNMNTDTKVAECSDEVIKENNRMQWLWDGTDTLLPSVYFGRKKLNTQERQQLVKGRINEAKRLQARTKGDKPIYSYVWFKYNDDRTEFVRKDDLINTLQIMKASGISGAILWGSSNDVNTKENCLLLQEYVANVLGPVVKQFTGRQRSLDDEIDIKNLTNKDVYEATTTETEEKTAIEEENKETIDNMNSNVTEKTSDNKHRFEYDVITNESDVNEKLNQEIFDVKAIDIENTGIEDGDMVLYQIPEAVANFEDTKDIPIPEESVFEDTSGEAANHEISIMKIKTKIYTVFGSYPTVYRFLPKFR